MIHLVAPEAESDLLDIWRYISRESSVRIADRLIDSIIERFLLLSNHPFAGRPRNDLRKDLRAFPIRPYVIFYRIERANILILRVLHGHRDIEALLGT